MSIFDAITVTDRLEEAVIDTLSAWFPTYIKEYELQAGIIARTSDKDRLPLPKSILPANELDVEPTPPLPAIVVVSPGMSPRNKPMQEGDGSFRVWYGIGIAAIVSGSNWRSTMDLSRKYAAIVRTIILQHQSLGGFADGCDWFDESYDNLPGAADNETIGASQVVFEFEVAGVVNRFAGPASYGLPEPDPDPVNQPGSNWPTVQTATAKVEVKE